MTKEQFPNKLLFPVMGILKERTYYVKLSTSYCVKNLMAKNNILKYNKRGNCRKQISFQRIVEHRQETGMIKNIET